MPINPTSIALASLVALSALSASAAPVSSFTATSGGITVTDIGSASAATANSLSQFSNVTNQVDAPIVYGQNTIISGNGGTGVGWSPYGSSNSTAYWVSVGGASSGSASSATFNFGSGTSAILFDWGSSSVTNTVTLYSGANGTGTALGTVSADGAENLYINSGSSPSLQNSNLTNAMVAGALIEIGSTSAFKSAVFSTAANSGGFEVGPVSAVPLPGALPMFGAALLGFGFLGRRWKQMKA